MMSDANFFLPAAVEARQWLSIGNHPYLYQLDYLSPNFPYPQASQQHCERLTMEEDL